MNLLKEAGYVYLYSKKLVYLNKKIKKLGKKAVKHKSRHEKAAEHKKEKHHVRHVLTVRQINALMEKHNSTLKKLAYHSHKFSECLRKEHKV
ncbi:MAG: hypothetical protein ABIA37_01890 [Candidatus Woesearchaeota archaeon]